MHIALWIVAGFLAASFLMTGAVSRHLRDHDGPQGYAPALTLGVLALIVATGRIWVAPF